MKTDDSNFSYGLQGHNMHMVCFAVDERVGIVEPNPATISANGLSYSFFLISKKYFAQCEISIFMRLSRIVNINAKLL